MTFEHTRFQPISPTIKKAWVSIELQPGALSPLDLESTAPVYVSDGFGTRRDSPAGGGVDRKKGSWSHISLAGAASKGGFGVMNKILIGFTLLLLAQGTAWGWSGLTGSIWSAMPHEAKMFYVSGFLSGFEAGYLAASGDDHQRDITFSPKRDNYVRELETFYSLYPKCLPGYVDNVLGLLAVQWSYGKREFSESAVKHCNAK
jgi:hypothetical protein